MRKLLVISGEDIEQEDFNQLFGWQLSPDYRVTIELKQVYDESSHLMVGVWAVGVAVYKIHPYGKDRLRKLIELDQCVNDNEFLKHIYISLFSSVQYQRKWNDSPDVDMRRVVQAALRKYGILYVLQDTENIDAVRLVFIIEANGVYEQFDTQGVPISDLTQYGEVNLFNENDLPN